MKDPIKIRDESGIVDRKIGIDFLYYVVKNEYSIILNGGILRKLDGFCNLIDEEPIEQLILSVKNIVLVCLLMILLLFKISLYILLILIWTFYIILILIGFILGVVFTICFLSNIIVVPASFLFIIYLFVTKIWDILHSSIVLDV
jgi:hypothetical protein